MPSGRWEPYTLRQTTILGAFQCSAYSANASPSCTSCTINFLGVEGPLSNDVGPSRVIWRNWHLLGCVGAFSRLLKCFSKLLAWLMVLLQWGHFSFLIWGSQWCCSSAASFEKNLVHFLHLCLVLSIKHSIGCSICRISSSVTANMASSWSLVKFLLQPISDWNKRFLCSWEFLWMLKANREHQSWLGVTLENF